MRKWAVFAALIYLLLPAFGCKSFFDPAVIVVFIEGPNFEDSVTIFRFTGRVKNTGDAKAMYVKIRISVFNAAGTLLAQNWNYCDDTELKAGETAGFEVLFKDEDGKIRASLDLSKTTSDILFE